MTSNINHCNNTNIDQHIFKIDQDDNLDQTSTHQDESKIKFFPNRKFQISPIIKLPNRLTINKIKFQPYIRKVINDQQDSDESQQHQQTQQNFTRKQKEQHFKFLVRQDEIKRDTIQRQKRQIQELSEVIDKFIDKYYHLNKIFLDQMSYVAKNCQCKKLRIHLIGLSLVTTKSFTQTDEDDIIRYKAEVEKSEFLFYRYSNKDITRLYLYFIYFKMYHQFKAISGQYYIDLADIQNETALVFQEHLAHARRYSKWVGVFTKANKFFNTMDNVLNSQWLLMDHQWVLDKHHSYDARQHIKNVSSTKFIPKKNRVIIQTEQYKQCSNFQVYSLNINYKQHVNSPYIGFKVLQKKLQTIKMLYEITCNGSAVCLQECQAGMNITHFVSYYLQYKHSVMVTQLKFLGLPFKDIQETRSGGLATFIKQELMHAQMDMNDKEFKDKVFFSQVFRVPVENGWLFLVNVYFFPDVYRKKVVHNEVEFIIYAIQKSYNPCNIIVIGDFNTNINQLDTSIDHHAYGLKVAHPGTGQFTHGKSIIDYALVSSDIQYQTEVIDVQSSHHMISLTAQLNTITVARFQNITNNTKINNLIKPQTNVFDIIKTDHHHIITLELRRLLFRKNKVRHVNNPFIEFLKNVKTEDLASTYCDQFKEQVFLAKYLSCPKKYYGLIKKFFKLNKTTPIVTQIKVDGVALSEIESEKAIYQFYMGLYGQNKKKVIRECRPANFLITPIDMINIRKRLHPDKAVCDNLLPFSLPHFDANLPYLCCTLANICTKQFPCNYFFDSRIICLKKKKDGGIPSINEIRPITVTSEHQKIMEDYLLSKLEYVYDKLAFSQLGFVKGQETYMHILRLISIIQTIWKENDESPNKVAEPKITLFFVDMQKAFDSIDQDILFVKLKKILDNEDLYNAFIWYFNQIGVNIGQHRIPGNQGSPQGGKPSPLLWLVFFNDLLLLLEALVGRRNVLCYADDLLIVNVSDEITLQCKKIIDEWSETNKIKINYEFDKSALVHIMQKVQRGRPIKDTSKKGELNAQKEYKYLGVVINQNLIFPIKKLDQGKQLACLLRFQPFSIRKKLALFQVFILGKFRHTFIAIKIYPQPDLQIKIENKILGLVRIVLNLFRTSPRIKLLEQQIINHLLTNLVLSADNRVLKKLQHWEDSHASEDPFNWMQYKQTDVIDIQKDDTWECILNSDCFWLRILIDSSRFFMQTWCKLCFQNVGSNQHIKTCPEISRIHIQNIQSSLAKELKIYYQQHIIIQMIYEPLQINKVVRSKNKRIAVKEIFAHHLTELSKDWVPDISFQYTKMSKKQKEKKKLEKALIKKNKNAPVDKQQTEEQYKKMQAKKMANRFPDEAAYQRQINHDADQADLADTLQNLYHINHL